MVTIQAAVLALALAGAGEPVLLDFYADWCGPCRQMEGTVRELTKRGYPVQKVNIDQQKKLAREFHVEGIPCFVLVVDGREVDRVVGATSRERLEQMFAKARRAGDVRGQSPDHPAPRMRFPGLPSEPGFPAPEVDGAALDVPGGDTGERVATAGQAIGTAHDVAAAARHSVEAVRDRLLAASVRVRVVDETNNSVGSGTIIDARAGEALVLTCGHIFRDSEGQGPITVDMFGPGAPQAVPGQLISYDAKSDVGLVAFRPGVPVTVVRVAAAGYQVRQGDPVINIGCNHGQKPTARLSRVTAIDKFLGPPNLVVAGQPVEGRSGGGLFTIDGRLIGVGNAADPADDEGLYAALASVYAEMDRAGLTEMCTEDVDPQTGNVALASLDPPPMPSQMPGPSVPRTRWQPTSDEAPRGARPAEGAPLSGEEEAALAEIRRRGEGAEVICVVRSLADPRAKSEIIVLDRASPEFLRQLSADERAQNARHPTSQRR